MSSTVSKTLSNPPYDLARNIDIAFRQRLAFQGLEMFQVETYPLT